MLAENGVEARFPWQGTGSVLKSRVPLTSKRFFILTSYNGVNFNTDSKGDRSCSNCGKKHPGRKAGRDIAYVVKHCDAILKASILVILLFRGEDFF